MHGIANSGVMSKTGKRKRWDGMKEATKVPNWKYRKVEGIGGAGGSGGVEGGLVVLGRRSRK